jgi:predicted  nucleic acid-binding Zn-ribbon protein
MSDYVSSKYDEHIGFQDKDLKEKTSKLQELDIVIRASEHSKQQYQTELELIQKEVSELKKSLGETRAQKENAEKMYSNFSARLEESEAKIRSEKFEKENDAF